MKRSCSCRRVRSILVCVLFFTYFSPFTFPFTFQAFELSSPIFTPACRSWTPASCDPTIVLLGLFFWLSVCYFFRLSVRTTDFLQFTEFVFPAYCWRQLFFCGMFRFLSSISSPWGVCDFSHSHLNLYRPPARTGVLQSVVCRVQGGCCLCSVYTFEQFCTYVAFAVVCRYEFSLT